MDQQNDSQSTVEIDRDVPELEAIAARIRAAPPPPKKMTKRQKIEYLKPTLLKAIADGHTSASLAMLLALGEGTDAVVIAERTLEEWLGLPKRRRTATRAGGRVKAVTSSREAPSA